VTGEAQGRLKVYRNVGTPITPEFLTEANGAPVAADLAYRDAIGIPDDIGAFSAPALSDLDGDGDLDLVIGTEDGPLLIYRNTGSATAPTFEEESGSMVSARRRETTPALGDLDGDGDPDLVVGNQSGGLLFFSQGAFTTGIGEAGPEPGPTPGLRAVPNPSSGRVTFHFGAPVRGEAATLVVYDGRGRTVARVPLAVGAADATWAPGAGAASGTYLARLEADGEVLASASFTRLR
jgi:hypothetical protein